MKLIDPSYEIIDQKSGTLEDIYKHIELCGRTCYKSEDKITEDSAKGFVDRMISSNHTAMLEHGTVYMVMDSAAACEYEIEPHSRVEYDDTGRTAYVTTNMRVLVENDWLGDLKHAVKIPTEGKHYPRHTVKLTTSLHVYKDLTRHRTMSFAIESTRYCNYSKDKYGNELTFIRPIWSNPSGTFTKNPDPDAIFESYCIKTEKAYLDLVALGWQAQQAAEVLPQCIKGDVIITGFEDDWNHIFDLRALGTTGAPHPEVQRIITPIMNEFYDRGYTNRNNYPG